MSKDINLMITDVEDITFELCEIGSGKFDGSPVSSINFPITGGKTLRLVLTRECSIEIIRNLAGMLLQQLDQGMTRHSKD